MTYKPYFFILFSFLPLLGFAQVHQVNRPIRFWGSPDSKTAWKAFNDLSIDFINTDHPFEANQYLSALKSNVTSSSKRHPIYTPTFEYDKTAPIKNIILMIGDGNGLAHISAGMFAHGNELNMAKLKHIGLVKTQSVDDFTTDSAAGATAYATGQKTNNRAISVSADDVDLQSLPELLKEYQFTNGIITTDRLTGATPAAFYSHVKDRDMVPEIAAALQNSSIDLFIGGGRSDFQNDSNNYIEQLEHAGYTFLPSLRDLSGADAAKVGYFQGEDNVPSVLQERGDYLSEATTGALQFLKKKEQPFFLMIEGAMIDTGGHWNSAETVVEEEIDFDKAVGLAVQFADQNPGTLVLITADHETGGVTLPQGDMKSGKVELNFETEDHTAIMVPLFAYGVHAEEFMGFYENTFVFEKLLELVKKAHH
jgi:alkaline phosphatase